MAQLGWLDTAIFLSYFVVVSLVGFFAVRRRNESARDYFIASEKLPWYLIGFGMLASSISTEQFIGSAGFAYKWGLPVFNWELSNFVAMLIMLNVFLPVYLRHRIVTIPEYLERRFGPTPRNIYAVVSILAMVFVMLAGVIYTGGFLLNQMFGLDVRVGIWLMVLVSGAYTVYGGLISVAWTQLLQGLLLLGGGLAVTTLGLWQVPGGFFEIIGSGPRAHLVPGLDHPELPWTAILVLTIPVNIWYWCTSQPIIQGCLGAKSRWHGEMGIVLSGFLLIGAAMTIEFPGLIAHTLLPDLARPDMAYPALVNAVVFPGLRGLVLAGLAAAVMSTIQALVHSASALFTMELYGKRAGTASDRRLIGVGRIATSTVLVVGALWAPMVGRFPTIFEFFQKTWFFFAGPIAAVFILAILWKRMSERAAVLTLCLCFPLFLLPYALRVVKANYGWQVNEYNLAGIVFVLSLLFAVIVSLFTAPKTPGADLLWSPELAVIPAGERPDHYRWHKAVWFWSLVWVACMVMIYAMFW